jgi:receptor expression-enhancing protein 5/6
MEGVALAIKSYGKMVEDKLPPVVQQHFKTMEAELNKIPYFVQFEEKTKLPKGYCFVIASTMFFCMVIMNVMAELLVTLLGLVYPGYMSFKAIETKETDDDKQWYILLTKG